MMTLVHRLISHTSRPGVLEPLFSPIVRSIKQAKNIRLCIRLWRRQLQWFHSGHTAWPAIPETAGATARNRFEGDLKCVTTAD